MMALSWQEPPYKVPVDLRHVRPYWDFGERDLCDKKIVIKQFLVGQTATRRSYDPNESRH